MRPLALLVASTLTLLALTSCSSDGDTDSPSAGTSPTSSPMGVTEAYGALATNAAAFYSAVAANPVPADNPPTTAEELQRNVDYVFTDGVAIETYDRTKGICFSGPDDTFLTVSRNYDFDLQRVFGTGECSTTKGDIIVVNHLDPEHPEAPVVDKFLKGEAMAADVEGMGDFTSYLQENQKMAVSH